MGESEETPVNVLKRSIVPVSGFKCTPLLATSSTGRPGDEVVLLVDMNKVSVNAQVTVMLMKNAIGIICDRITWTSKLL